MTKKKIIIGLTAFIVLVSVAALTAIAVTNYGSQTNPLVTKSYIDNVASKHILDEVEKQIQTAADELDERITNKLENHDAGSISVPTSYDTVTLKTGQVVRCSVGTEIILRSGTATCYGNGPDFLYDATAGTVLTTAGTSMSANHLYLVTYGRNGFRARSNNTVVLISGDYTIYSNL